MTISKLFSEADMQPIIQKIDFPVDRIVRNYSTTGSILLKVSHNEGAIISSVSSGSNFDIDIFLTSEEPDMSNANFSKLPPSAMEIVNKPIFRDSMLYATSKDVTINITIDIDIDMCSILSHLCVNLTKGSTGFYFETNSSNNIHCISIKQFANCQPGM